jgi:predicted aldo/keto reductase-like oxidoreductase
MVLSGMSNLSQLNDNISYMKELIPLTEKENALCFEAAEIILREDNIPCTACRYCVTECPVCIPIPEYFAAYNNHKAAAYSHLSKKQSISNCIECHACEGHCPQHIAIPQMLKRVQEKFE